MSSDSSADSNDQMCWSLHASLAHVQCKHWPIPIPSYLKASLSAKYQEAKEDGTKASWGRSKDTCNTVRAEYEKNMKRGVRWSSLGFARVSLGFAGVRWGSLGFARVSLGFAWVSLGFRLGSPQESPKRAQESPKRAQESPERAQESPKRAPREPKRAPKRGPREATRAQESSRNPEKSWTSILDS